jgi:hypothetical protein
MSAAAKDREAERKWLDEQQHTVHDEQDAATDPERMPPLGWVLAGAAVLLVVVCGLLGWALPIIADRVFQ